MPIPRFDEMVQVRYTLLPSIFIFLQLVLPYSSPVFVASRTTFFFSCLILIRPRASSLCKEYLILDRATFSPSPYVLYISISSFIESTCPLFIKTSSTLYSFSLSDAIGKGGNSWIFFSPYASPLFLILASSSLSSSKKASLSTSGSRHHKTL